MADKWLSQLKEAKCLPEGDLRQLCQKAKEIFIEESNVQYITAPVIICGDIHGQLYDLFKLFKKGGEIPNSRYVFLGDYVDRGYNSVEVIELLLALKVKYPSHITLLRGNHESRKICFSYGFYEEVNKKYGNTNPWHYFIELFDYFPLAALIEGKIFCVHGGLSPFFPVIDLIRLTPRKREPPECTGFGGDDFDAYYHGGGGVASSCKEEAMTDLLWSDPDDDLEKWMVSMRGVGWIFGWKVVDTFNHFNGLELVCRAHQLIMEGFKYHYKKKNLCTVWSAPNYCYRCGNKASILKIGENLSRSIEYFDFSVKSVESQPPRTLIPYFL